ncbi:MAG: hypothetical protein U0163_15380 [Gemmatimonadaceae bacterium]
MLTRVIDAGDAYDYYREPQRFTSALGDGHAVSFPNALATERTYPAADSVGRWSRGGSKLRARPREHIDGTEITAINGRPASDFLEDEVLPYTAASTVHWRWALAARDALTGRKFSESVRLQYQRPDGARGDTSSWPATDDRARTPVPPTETPRIELRWLGDSVALVSLRSFGLIALRANSRPCFRACATHAGSSSMSGATGVAIAGTVGTSSRTSCETPSRCKCGALGSITGIQGMESPGL